MDDDSDSSLSSTHSIDDEVLIAKMNQPAGITRFFQPIPKSEEKQLTPEPPKRVPSPPHEYVLADNEAIAFVVMFRSRFSDAFPKSLPHYGPQDIERGISGDVPHEDLERLLCALLGLVLNRKKDVERGHYGRALEDAVQQNSSQWPKVWNGQNPLHGGKSFNSMTPEERLTLLKTLVLWALNASEGVQALIKSAYKQTRRDDDKNQPKSVQPWFSDSYRRKYYLIEGLEDTHFRVYRENDGKTAKTNTWFNVAGSIEEVAALAEKFEGDGTSLGKVNGSKIKSAVPRFEIGDDKRKRREYRQARKAAFARPEPGFSLYEGRTRGKRMRYTYSDGEEDSDATSGQRSGRTSAYATPSEIGPTITSSGRHVKSRLGGMYGESLPLDQRREIDREQDEKQSNNGDGDTVQATGRHVRPVARGRGRYAEGLQSESETDAGAESSGKEWSGNEDESDESEPEAEFDDGEEEDGDMTGIEDEEEDDNTQESLVVQLRYRPGSKLASLSQAASRKGTPLREVTNISDSNGMNGSNKRGPEAHDNLTMNAKPAVTMSNGTSLPNGPNANAVPIVNGMPKPHSSVVSAIGGHGFVEKQEPVKPEMGPQLTQPMDLS